MRISNLLHFTENHRFYTYRDFSLSSMDDKMLTQIYQPMIGPMAISLYTLLVQQIPADKLGYSPLEQQRKLFLSLGLEPNQRGRKCLIDQTSKLEAVGLMQSYRKYLPDEDDYVYAYYLYAPLSPMEFFKNQHLTLLLRDVVGKHTAIYLKEQLFSMEPAEIQQQQVNAENLSVPFYELFQLNAQDVDEELEAAFTETNVPTFRGLNVQDAFRYSDLIMRFPQGSPNRPFIEQLKNQPDQLAAINYVAKKYHLSLQETCRLLDEDGVFSPDGSLQFDVLQNKANWNYRQNIKRHEERERHLHKVSIYRKSEQNTIDSEHTLPLEEKSVEMEYYLEVPPMFQKQCNIHQYNLILRNEPYTLVLQRFFPGTVPEHVRKIFEKIDLNYKLEEEVINVLIHYLHVDQLPWSAPYIDSIVSDMLGKQINSYEKAVQYIREIRERKYSREKSRSHSGFKTGAKRKPKIQMVNVSTDASISDEEYEEILRMAREIEGK